MVEFKCFVFIFRFFNFVMLMVVDCGYYEIVKELLCMINLFMLVLMGYELFKGKNGGYLYVYVCLINLWIKNLVKVKFFLFLVIYVMDFERLEFWVVELEEDIVYGVVRVCY